MAFEKLSDRIIEYSLHAGLVLKVCKWESLPRSLIITVKGIENPPNALHFSIVYDFFGANKAEQFCFILESDRRPVIPPGLIMATLIKAKVGR